MKPCFARHAFGLQTAIKVAWRLRKIIVNPSTQIVGVPPRLDRLNDASTEVGQDGALAGTTEQQCRFECRLARTTTADKHHS